MNSNWTGRKSIQEIAEDHAIHPIQVSQWKGQLVESASELFTRGDSNDKDEGQAKEAKLFQQIDRLQIELKWLKHSLSYCDARKILKIVDRDHPEASPTDKFRKPLEILRVRSGDALSALSQTLREG